VSPDAGAEAARRALGWVGTPYVHQASCRGVGADCLGLVRGVWRELHGKEPAAVPAYAADWAESGAPGLLEAGLWRHLTPRPVTDEAPGDVLLFRLRPGGAGRHLGMQTACGAVPRFVHAYSGHGVVESVLTPPWRRRLIARFAFQPRPGVAPVDGAAPRPGPAFEME